MVGNPRNMSYKSGICITIVLFTISRYLRNLQLVPILILAGDFESNIAMRTLENRALLGVRTLYCIDPLSLI